MFWLKLQGFSFLFYRNYSVLAVVVLKPIYLMEPSMTSDNTLSADWDWNFPGYVLRMDRRALEKPRVLALV